VWSNKAARTRKYLGARARGDQHVAESKDGSVRAKREHGERRRAAAPGVTRLCGPGRLPEADFAGHRMRMIHQGRENAQTETLEKI
jgi:hypothetical protein